MCWPSFWFYDIGTFLIFLNILLWIIAIVLCSAYFGGRYYLIKSRGRTEIIRRRTRKESFIDLICVGVILITAMSTTYYITRYLAPNFIQWLEGTNLQYRFIMLSLFICLIIFFYIGIVARGVSDFANLVMRETEFTLKSMYFSGNLLLLTTAFLFALTFAAHDFYYRWDFLLLIALASTVVVSFQTVTARIKLNQIEKKGEVDSGVSIEIE